MRPWWRKPTLWWPLIMHEARRAVAWDGLNVQDWEAIAIYEIPSMARDYWQAPSTPTSLPEPV